MIHFVREGAGRPLLLIHGLGGTYKSWDLIRPSLVQTRDVVALDLPGHGASPAVATSWTVKGLADSVEVFILDQKLVGIDAVGSSLGASIVLELTRRGLVGAGIALDPGGFWRGWEKAFFQATMGASVKLVRGIKPGLSVLSGNAVARALLLAQLSARARAIPAAFIEQELQSLAATQTVDALIQDLLALPEPQGLSALSTGPIVLGWGRKDRLCLPRQAARAQKAFPAATVHWFEHSSHFPMWDQPADVVRLVLSTEGAISKPQPRSATAPA